MRSAVGDCTQVRSDRVNSHGLGNHSRSPDCTPTRDPSDWRRVIRGWPATNERAPCKATTCWADAAAVTADASGTGERPARVARQQHAQPAAFRTTRRRAAPAVAAGPRGRAARAKGARSAGSKRWSGHWARVGFGRGHSAVCRRALQAEMKRQHHHVLGKLAAGQRRRIGRGCEVAGSELPRAIIFQGQAQVAVHEPSDASAERGVGL
jgi:hypothetical protein